MCQMKQWFRVEVGSKLLQFAVQSIQVRHGRKPVYKREDLQPGECISGAAIIIETGTNVLNGLAGRTRRNYLI